MSKLPNKEFASSFQRNVETSGTVVSDDGVVAGEDGCLLFERRLNDWVDLRCDEGEISSDPHLSACAHCRAMLDDYQSMLEATQLLAGSHSDDVGEDSLVVGGRAATMDSFTADSASSRIVGWSTLLAVMFVFWGTSAGGPTDMSLTEGVSPTSMAGVQVQPTEFVSELNLAELSGYPRDLASHLVVANPLVQSAPASCQPFFEMPTGRLLAAGLPAVDLATVDIGQLHHIGQYWQHASRLPGIAPWQHSVNFAIGWFNQPALPNGKPRCS